MTRIRVDLLELSRAIVDLRQGVFELEQPGSQVIIETADALSYEGQYAPWVQRMASELDHDLRILAQEFNELIFG